MKSKTKKILTSICAIVLSVFMFAGCNLIKRNDYKYFNEEVAKVEIKDGLGEEYKVFNKSYTKKDLLTAYYNYAYNYVTQGQIDTKTAVEYAMNNMINTDLLVNYLKVKYFNSDEYPDLVFSDADLNDAKLEAQDSMQNSIYDIEEDVFEEWGIDFVQEESEEETEESETLRKQYEEFIPTIILRDIEGSEVAILNPETIEVTHDERVASDTFKQVIRYEGVSQEAYTRYVKQLQDAAKAEGNKDTSEKTVLKNELNRLQEIYIRSKYLDIFKEWYTRNQNFTYDKVNNVYILRDEVKSKVLNYYKEQFNDQKYNSTEEEYHELMSGSDLSKVYYHYNSGNEYVYVSHILLNFSDAQKAEIARWKSKLDKELITQEKYDLEVKNIANRTVVTYEINGKTYTSNAVNVYNKIVNYVSAGSTAKEKAKLFNDMIYVYNDDPGIMNADFSYVVNLDTTRTDKMVKPFADKAREMHQNEVDGTGAVGDLSDMVITEYGVHIMFYGGEVKNIVEDADTLTFNDLVNAKTQLSTEKSLFDLVFNTINTDGYNSATSRYVQICRDDLITIKFNDDAIKELYN